MSEILREGDVFRNPRISRIEEPIVDGFRNIKHVTRGRHERPLDFGKGMPRVAGRGGRVPATCFHTKEKEGEFPDIIDYPNRVVKYYGDNYWRTRPDGTVRAHASAYDSYGIKLFSELEHLYLSDSVEDRESAPPILIFEEFRIDRLAMRRFVGVGVLISSETVMQPHEMGDFENVVYHVSLIDLPDGLDWAWIDDLRSGGRSWGERAPEHWVRWVDEGHGCLDLGGRDASMDKSDARRLPRVPDPFTVIEEKEPDDGTGHVYAITNPAWEGWGKIGRARDARKRRRNYLTYSPKRDYKLEYAVYCEDRVKGEEDAHEYACMKSLGRRKSEWFPLSVGKAKEVLDRIGEPVDVRGD